jgi:hypothetical protein
MPKYGKYVRAAKTFRRQKNHPMNQASIYVSADKVTSSGSCSSFPPDISVGKSCNEAWIRLCALITQWIQLYDERGRLFDNVIGCLCASNLVEVRKSRQGKRLVMGKASVNSWFEAMNMPENEFEEYLISITDQLSSALKTLRSPIVLEPTIPFSAGQPSQLDPTKIDAVINGVSVSLNFKNSGNNEVQDIETYLQEKLDVLEFIQMDCNKMDISQFPSQSSRIMKAPQVDKTNISVADWYGSNRSVLPVSDSDEFVESVHNPNQRSQLKDLANDGFFIGTPTARSEIADSAISLLDQSQLEWETSSVLSSHTPRNYRGNRGSSRNRSFSNSSVSSADESRSKPTGAGMFGRGRLARLTANMSGYNDENSNESLGVSHADGVAAASSWW